MAGFVATLILLAIITAGFVPARTARRLLLRLFAARRLDATKRAAKLFKLAFVGKLLALGDLDEFQHFVELVNHLFERFGNLRGMGDGLADGRGFGGTEIGGLRPLPLRRWFRATVGSANFGPAVTRGFARRHGSTRRLRRIGGFRDGFGLVSFLRPGFGRGKLGGRFRVRFAKIAGRIGFVFRVLGMFRRFDRWCGGFNHFRRG